jgi:sugar lactone lactonase YvrE
MTPLHRLAVIVIAAAGLAASAGAASASHVSILERFDASKGEFSEGLALDRRGSAYVSFINPVAEVRKIGWDGRQSVVASFDVGGFGPLGLEFDRRGRLYVALSTFDPATRGIYVVQSDGSTTRLPGTEAIEFPNDITFDRRGNAYATDTIAGAVYRIPRGGSAELWYQDPVLLGDGSAQFGFPLGANGIVHQRRTLLVAVTEGARVVRIPIARDGSAGTASVVAEGPALYGADGIDIDGRGTAFVANLFQSTILKLNRSGGITTIATAADGLDDTSSVVHAHRGGPDRLFAVNFAVIPPMTTGPALLSVALGAHDDDEDDQDDEDDE